MENKEKRIQEQKVEYVTHKDSFNKLTEFI